MPRPCAQSYYVGAGRNIVWNVTSYFVTGRQHPGRLFWPFMSRIRGSPTVVKFYYCFVFKRRNLNYNLLLCILKCRIWDAQSSHCVATIVFVASNLSITNFSKYFALYFIFSSVKWTTAAFGIRLLRHRIFKLQFALFNAVFRMINWW